MILDVFVESHTLTERAHLHFFTQILKIWGRAGGVAPMMCSGSPGNPPHKLFWLCGPKSPVVHPQEGVLLGPRNIEVSRVTPEVLA